MSSNNTITMTTYDERERQRFLEYSMKHDYPTGKHGKTSRGIPRISKGRCTCDSGPYPNDELWGHAAFDFADKKANAPLYTTGVHSQESCGTVSKSPSRIVYLESLGKMMAEKGLPVPSGTTTTVEYKPGEQSADDNEGGVSVPLGDGSVSALDYHDDGAGSEMVDGTDDDSPGGVRLQWVS